MDTAETMSKDMQEWVDVDDDMQEWVDVDEDELQKQRELQKAHRAGL